MKLKVDLYSRANQVVLDALTFAAALVLSYLIRFEGVPGPAELRQLFLWLPLLVSARLAVHTANSIYRQVWKFVSFSDALQIAKSIAIVSAALLVLRLSYRSGLEPWLHLPLGVITLEGSLSLIGSVATRGLRRILYFRQRRALISSGRPMKRVLLYGAGRAGIMLRKELEMSRSFEVVGFIDDDPRKIGSIISATRVIGNGDHLPDLVERFRVDEVIISMATASRITLAKTLAKCKRANLSAKIIPSLPQLLIGQAQISQLRETRVEEVLGRESVEVLEFVKLAGSAYRDKRVLVTGAGGSIGSELVRQLIRLSPSQVAILDKDENSIYELEQQLRSKTRRTVIEPMIADVRHLERLRSLFSRFRPQILFHAAAHKHVPLMELHPCEAILNNVGGTKNVIDLAAEFGAQRFVFISSDKAVNPTNVMGATKRIGELLVQASMRSKHTRFSCVRFGNVLGSRGSVVPLFQRQIAEGGPLTVTHPDVFRYFMTIPEAVQLILCAGTLATGGETFVLDMGTPRNILDLAREMILLSGLEPEKDIQTKIIGLRPGEKLLEELATSQEKLLPTHFEKLSFIEPRRLDETALMRDVAELIQHAQSNNADEIFEILSSMDLGYRPLQTRSFADAAAG